LFALTSLEELDVSNNAIDSISNNISSLKQLRDLKLFRNQLKGLPAGIGALVRLKKLDVSHNQLISLPSQFLYLTSLVVLSTYLSFSQQYHVSEFKSIRFNVVRFGLYRNLW
jgi:Leucine-rich repeat (LRR) protein